MTPTGMAALRIAATLAHVLPGLRVRLRHGDRPLLEVAHPAHASGPAVGPCGFRRAVTRAHEHLKAGARIGFLDLPEGVEPAVDIDVASGGRALPGGIFEVPRGGEVVVGFATTLSVRQCRAILARADVEVVGEPVQLHRDTATEITFVHVVEPEDRTGGDGEHPLHAVLAACLADEVVRSLAGAAR